MHKSNWGFLIDVNYLDLSSDINLPGPFNMSANVDEDGSEADLFRFDATMHGPVLGVNFRW